MSTPWERRVGDIADLLVWTTSGKPPTLGSTRLVCVDGRAGSGKTTLGKALRDAAVRLGSARLLHMDDMYEGWSGLGDALTARIDQDLLGPLREDRPGRYRRYDWASGRFAEWHTVDPVDLLVLEGVGSAGSSYADAVTTLVWVEAPRELRIERGVARDGRAVLPRWLQWMDDEDVLFARERTRQRADVVVDGTGEGDRAVVFE
ncbi:MAG TPA: 4-amino-4-deoxy-L-arabinose transferase [Nocardioidaceae bacterium]|nr:4-amino-4-deoxy-L-arabinose transferase [Nocardioidaceae bacterium]